MDPKEIRDTAADKARKTAETAIEEVKVASNQLVDRVRGLIEEGNVRRILIKREGKTLLEVPLTVAAGAGAAVLFITPVLAAVGALAALVTDVSLVIERNDESSDNGGGQGQQSGGQSASGGSTSAQSGSASKPVTDHEGKEAAKTSGASGKTIGK